MVRVLGRYSSYAYAVMRIVFGFLFMFHGTQKLFGWPPSEHAGEFTALVAIAGVIELLGGLMIMFGFFSSFAAFIVSGTMAVAYFMVHQPKGLLPIMNGGELAVIYCFVALYIASRGSGMWSIDSVIRAGKEPGA